MDLETQRQIELTAEFVLEQPESWDRLTQGLFVTAQDLNTYLSRKDDFSRELDSYIKTAVESQDDWVRSELQNTDIPDGFAKSAEKGEMSLVAFDDPRIDHEYVFYPGEEIFAQCVKGYYQVICSDKGIRGILQDQKVSKSTKIVDGASLLIDAVETGACGSPFATTLVACILFRGVDRVCSEYDD